MGNIVKGGRIFVEDVVGEVITGGKRRTRTFNPEHFKRPKETPLSDADAITQELKEGAATGFTPTQITTPAGTTTFDEATGRIMIERSPEFTRAITGIETAGQEFRTAIDQAIQDVKPGFGRLTQAAQEAEDAALAELEAGRSRTVGNLRDNLQRRRILGSSFATDAIARAEAEYELKKSQISASSEEAKSRAFLQELDLTTQLQSQKNASRLDEVSRIIGQMNIDTQTGLALSGQANQVLSANAQLQNQLALAIAQIQSNFAITQKQIDAQLRIAEMQQETAGLQGLGELFGMGLKGLMDYYLPGSSSLSKGGRTTVFPDTNSIFGPTISPTSRLS